MIIIKGRPISKKNNRVGNNNRFFITSKRYKQWEDEALWQLKGKRLENQTMIRLRFCMKGKLDADLDNLVTSVLDVLQKAGILKNDKTIVHLTATKEFGFSEWTTEIL